MSCSINSSLAAGTNLVEESPHQTSTIPGFMNRILYRGFVDDLKIQIIGMSKYLLDMNVPPPIECKVFPTHRIPRPPRAGEAIWGAPTSALLSELNPAADPRFVTVRWVLALFLAQRLLKIHQVLLNLFTEFPARFVQLVTLNSPFWDGSMPR